MEADLTRLSSENEELISEFRAADERAKKAITDVSTVLIPKNISTFKYPWNSFKKLD